MKKMYWFLVFGILVGFKTGNAQTIRTIYISQQLGIDENNDGSDQSRPIRTLARAYALAHQHWPTTDKFEILLRAGERFDGFVPLTNALLTDYDPARNTFAFIWDIDRELHLSTYGNDQKALLYSGQYTHEGGPSAGMAITEPSTKAVVVENLHFKRWQVSAIFTYETQNVSFLNNIVEEVGTLYFPDEQVDGIYGAGAIYPKNSSQVLIEGNYVRNVHNQFADLDKMHVFYLTRLRQSVLKDNIVINASGPPLKFRRELNNNVVVTANEFYYTGPTLQLYQTQEGFVRYSGDVNGGCPFAITIENNKFYYPYCWEDRERCDRSARGIRCSISNETVCGADACGNEDRIRWINNDFRYRWEEDQVPEWPEDRILTSTKAQEVTDQLGFNYSLFPNPFSEAVTIQLKLNQSIQVKVTLFDRAGKVVGLILDQRLGSGVHRLTWDGRQPSGEPLATGLYFCQIQTDQGSVHQKILLQSGR